MNEVPAELAVQHQQALAALAVPMSTVCMRSLRNTAARDHVYAQIHRKAGRAQHGRHYIPRAERLSRAAALAEARALDLTAQARA